MAVSPLLKNITNSNLPKICCNERSLRQFMSVLFLNSLVVFSTTPVALASSVQSNLSKSATEVTIPVANPSGAVKVSPHVSKVFIPEFTLTANSTDAQISQAVVYSEPLTPATWEKVVGENAALVKAISEDKNSSGPWTKSALITFLEKYPKSRWAPAVENELARRQFESGFLSKALSSWSDVWEKMKTESGASQVALANNAISNLVLLDARLGRTDDLKKYFQEIKGRPIFGSDEARVTAARQGLREMLGITSKAFKCGPYALNNLLNLKTHSNGVHPILLKASSTLNGTNLWQAKEWSKEIGLNYQAVKREHGSEIVYPALVHLSLGHFAAITGFKDGRYEVKDPTFDQAGHIWMTAEAIESETDGYFLIENAKALPAGWSAVGDEEAKTVWGKGGAHTADYNIMGCPNGVSGTNSCPVCPDGGPGGGGGSGPPGGAGSGPGPGGSGAGAGKGKPMAQAGAYTMQATLTISDTPVSYTPPLGPGGSFSVRYDHLESNQPGSFTFSNLGYDWTFNWLSYLTVDGSGVVTLRKMGGGSEVFTPDSVTGLYPPDLTSQATLIKVSSSVYQRKMPDGSMTVFNQQDGSGRIFMTSYVDSNGLSALVNLDPYFRISTIVDAIGQTTTLNYISNTVGATGFYVISSVVDPFGRTASFSFDPTATRLLQITDSIGLKSKFAYDTASSFITQMTTPYGTTSFYRYVPDPSDIYPGQGLRITYPDGTASAVENWLGTVSASFYWDRHALQLYPDEPNKTSTSGYTHCEFYKYQSDFSTGLEKPIFQTVIHPLETSSPIDFRYPGQTNTDYIGTSNKVAQTSRPLGNPITLATFGGTVTPGDSIEFGILHQYSIYYNAVAGDTPSTVASHVAALVNADTNLQNLGVYAAATGPVIAAHSDNPIATQFFYNFNFGGSTTETCTLYSQTKQFTTATIAGTPTVGDTSTFYVNTPTTSREAFNHTVVAGDTLATIMADFATQIAANTVCQQLLMTATASGPNLYLTSYSPLVATYGSGGSYIITFSDVRNGGKQMQSFEYNSLGLMTKSVDDALRTFSYVYDTNNIDLLQIKETQGTDNYQLGAWTYNSYHCPLTYTDGSGQVTHYAYNSSNQLISVTDANSNVTTLTYTGTSSATVGGTITAGDIVTLTVHDAGLSGGQQAVSYTVAAGNTTTTIATGLKNAVNANTSLQAIGVTATSSAAVVTLNSTSTNVTTYTSSTSTGATETIALGANRYGFLTKIDGPLAGSQDITTLTYDTVGRVATVTNSESYTLSFGYDNADRLVTTTYPDGTTEKTTWDKLDPIFTKDRLGRVSQSSFDSLDELVYQIDPLGRKTQYVWCTCGSLLTLTDPAGHATNWAHDLQGRVTQKIYQDSTTVNYTYDKYAGRVFNVKDALNQYKYFYYYPDGKPYQTSYLNAVNPTATTMTIFDPKFNRVTSSQKNDWGTISYTYNPYILPGGAATTGGGRLSLVHNDVIANSDTTYSYDSLGRTTNRSINGASNSDTWTFDAMSRVTGETNALGSFTYAYVDDVSGSSKGTTRLASVTYPNSQVTKYSWYPASGDERLQQIANLKTANGPTISQYSHRYDPAGQMTQWQQLQNNSSLNYSLGYDQAGQLVSSQAGSGGPSAAYQKQNYYAYDLGSNRTGSQQNSVNRVRIGGTITVGNTLTITVVDSGLAGGQKAITYTTVTGDTLAKVATGLAAAITADTSLQTLGVNASANGSTLSIKSASPNITTYTQSTSGGATETIALGITANFVENLVVGGTKTTGNTVTVTVMDPALSGGQTAVTYTVVAADTLATIATGLKNAINANTSLSTLGVTATVVGTNITIKSNSNNATTYAQSTSAGATETLTLSINQNGPQTIAIGGTKTTSDIITVTVYDAALSGGLKAVTYTVAAGDTLATIATNLAAALTADTSLQGVGISAAASGQVVTLSSNSLNATTLRASTSSSATETLAINVPVNGVQTAVIGGTKTTGSTITITVYDAGLTGGSKTVTYTVVAADTLTSIATAIAAAITADTSLASIGVSATSSGTVVNILSSSINMTTYAKSTSGGATETVTLAPASSATQYGYNTVNELTSSAAGGPTAFLGSANKALASATINSAPANLAWSQSFNGNASLASGANNVLVSGTDGAANVKTNNYQVNLTGPASKTLTFDANGNMTSDGTNGYVWDAENRLIQVTYPGSGNNSQFSYDSYSGLVNVTERVSAAIVDFKQFVRIGGIAEQRDSSASVMKQFFPYGENVSGAKYTYFFDHLSSIREISNSSGALETHYEYDLLGRNSKSGAGVMSDFQFGNYYYHEPSKLNFCQFRAYSSSLGRWINRDPVEENGGLNMYTYVGNDTVNNEDPSGLEPLYGTYPNTPSFTSGWEAGANGNSAQSYFYYGCVGICSYYSGSPNPSNPAAGAKLVKCFSSPAGAAAMNCDCPQKRYQFIVQGAASGDPSGPEIGGPHFNYVGFTSEGTAVGGNHMQTRNVPGKGEVAWKGAKVTYSFSPILFKNFDVTKHCVICR